MRLNYSHLKFLFPIIIISVILLSSINISNVSMCNKDISNDGTSNGSKDLKISAEDEILFTGTQNALNITDYGNQHAINQEYFLTDEEILNIT
mgnify:FL=1